VKLHASAALPPGKEPPVRVGYEAGWASEPVWTLWRRENSYFYRDSNSDPSAVQPVSQQMSSNTVRAIVLRSTIRGCINPLPHTSSWPGIHINAGIVHRWDRLCSLVVRVSGYIIQRSRVRFAALPDFLRSSGSGTGSTQPREDN
jgi:hypothetical protein